MSAADEARKSRKIRMSSVPAHIRVKRTRRFALLAASLAILAAGITLVTIALEDNISFFLTPSELAHKRLPLPVENIRIGGMVAQNSLRRDESGELHFRITDLHASLPVRFLGIPPDLFAEERGVIAEGRLTASGVLVARRILAKHDEVYMPPAADMVSR